MKMLINSEWLRKKMETEPDIDFEVGMPLEQLPNIDCLLPCDVTSVKDIGEEEKRLRIKAAFGVTVNRLRRRDGLSIEALSKRAEIVASELTEIENDPNFQARPRTIVKLAGVFRVNPDTLIQLSGAVEPTNSVLECEALKFAAKSQGVSSLNDEERQLLNSFVELLNKKA